MGEEKEAIERDVFGCDTETVKMETHDFKVGASDNFIAYQPEYKDKKLIQ
ncbi:hypothetical protein [Fodinibius sp.]|nr:hypothetical protein [Fodinibius sp.]MDZ7660376.1 hypothetical protein [Fodinibius sp.]